MFLRLKAAALFYAVAISLLIALISSSLLLVAYFSRMEFNSAMMLSRAANNARSGMNILLGAPEEIPLNKKTSYDLFGDGDDDDEVELLRKPWGFFEVATAIAGVGKFNQVLTALTGSRYLPYRDVALYLPDQDHPLSLCGKSVIRGTCFLPDEGVKRAYIEGMSFQGDKLVEGEVKKSGRKLPEVNRELIETSFSYFSGGFTETDSIVDYEKAAAGDSLYNSFFNRSLVLYSAGPVTVVNKRFSGNIKIVSGEYAFISSQSVLNDILIYAPVVEIEKNFTGSLQAFASDSIFIRSGSILNYPSVVALISNVSIKAGTTAGKGGVLHFEENTGIDGLVFAYGEDNNAQNRLSVSLEKNTVVRGLVYTYGLLELKGSVFGTVMCSEFILSTPSSVYENHLLNAEIDATKLSEYFIGAAIFPDESPTLQDNGETKGGIPRGIVKWF